MKILLQVVTISALATVLCVTATAEVYHLQDSAITMAPSDDFLLIQFDSTVEQKSSAEFFEAHPCLDDQALPDSIDRGYWKYALASSCGWTAASADVGGDNTVHRVVPVYETGSGGQYIFTDLIAVEFTEDLTVGDMESFLSERNLLFYDSSLFIHGLWRAMLADSMPGSPVPYADEMHQDVQTTWCAPSTYAEPELNSPSDPYLVYQEYFTGPYNIGLDSAWRVALTLPRFG